MLDSIHVTGMDIVNRRISGSFEQTKPSRLLFSALFSFVFVNKGCISRISLPEYAIHLLQCIPLHLNHDEVVAHRLNYAGSDPDIVSLPYDPFKRHWYNVSPCVAENLPCRKIRGLLRL